MRGSLGSGNSTTGEKKGRKPGQKELKLGHGNGEELNRSRPPRLVHKLAQLVLG
jgi:hypothetical protein